MRRLLIIGIVAMVAVAIGGLFAFREVAQSSSTAGISGLGSYQGPSDNGIGQPHYACYFALGVPFDPQPVVSLLTKFGLEESVEVGLPYGLCAPAIKTMPPNPPEGDPTATHLRAFQIDEPAPTPNRVVNISTEFGTFNDILLGNAGFLLAPTSKDVLPQPPGAHYDSTDEPHYKCYAASADNDVPGVLVQDQFDPAPAMPWEVLELQGLCVPAGKNGADIPDAPDLACFKAETGSLPVPYTLNLETQFGPEEGVVIPPVQPQPPMLCVPAQTVEVQPHYACYGTLNNVLDPEELVQLETRFGFEADVDVGLGQGLCAPAIKTLDVEPEGSLQFTHLRAFALDDWPLNKVVTLDTEFGTLENVLLGNAATLLTPTSKEVVDPAGPFYPITDEPHYKCYSATAEAGAQVLVEDQFSPGGIPWFVGDLTGVCLPVGKNSAPIPDAPDLACFIGEHAPLTPPSYIVNLHTQFNPPGEDELGVIIPSDPSYGTLCVPAETTTPTVAADLEETAIEMIPSYAPPLGGDPNGFLGLDNDGDGRIDEDGNGRFDFDGDTEITPYDQGCVPVTYNDGEHCMYEDQAWGRDDDQDCPYPGEPCNVPFALGGCMEYCDEDPLDAAIGTQPTYTLKEMVTNHGPSMVHAWDDKVFNGLEGSAGPSEVSAEITDLDEQVWLVAPDRNAYVKVGCTGDPVAVDPPYDVGPYPGGVPARWITYGGGTHLVVGDCFVAWVDVPAWDYDELVVRKNVELPPGDSEVDRTFDFACAEPSIHRLRIEGNVNPKDPEANPDPDPDNNWKGFGGLAVACIDYADGAVTDGPSVQWHPDEDPAEPPWVVQVSTSETRTVDVSVQNNGSRDPADFVLYLYELSSGMGIYRPPDPANGRMLDTDGDGWADNVEGPLLSDPNNENSTPEALYAFNFVGFTCSDGLDNDSNGLKDGLDPKCQDSDGDGHPNVFEAGFGSNPGDPTSTPEHMQFPWTCGDGIDNDGNGGQDGAEADGPDSDTLGDCTDEQLRQVNPPVFCASGWKREAGDTEHVYVLGDGTLYVGLNIPLSLDGDPASTVSRDLVLHCFVPSPPDRTEWVSAGIAPQDPHVIDDNGGNNYILTGFDVHAQCAESADVSLESWDLGDPVPSPFYPRQRHDLHTVKRVDNAGPADTQIGVYKTMNVPVNCEGSLTTSSQANGDGETVTVAPKTEYKLDGGAWTDSGPDGWHDTFTEPHTIYVQGSAELGDAQAELGASFVTATTVTSGDHLDVQEDFSILCHVPGDHSFLFTNQIGVPNWPDICDPDIEDITSIQSLPVHVDPPPPAVGGIQELPDVGGASAEEAGAPGEGSGWSAGAYAALAGLGALAAAAIAAGGWYARRRWVRSR
jgi:hypothetical protein